MADTNKVILTDVDGVLLNWEYAFDQWMQQHDYKRNNNKFVYNIMDRYDLTPKKSRELIRYFNESAAIGFLPPLRDAMYYVDLLHRKHGYVFHVITSLSLDPAAGQLRTNNLQKLFGETVFERFVYLDTGADKDEILAEYKNTGYVWIEDKTENAEAGLKQGLNSILVEHGHNMNYNNPAVPIYKNWKEIYDAVSC